MNLDQLCAQLELTEAFKDRQTLASDLATKLEASELAVVTKWLGHANESVRLGAIEILRAAGFRPALKFLAAVTLQRTGDERAFAARAVAQLVDPEDEGDRKLAEPLVARWRAIDDEFLHIHADALAKNLGLESGAGGGQALTPSPDPSSAMSASRANQGERSMARGSSATLGPVQGITAPEREVRERAIARTIELLDDPERAFVDALVDTRHTGARLDLVQAIERLGAHAMCRVLDDVMGRADLDSVTLFLRGLRRGMSELDEERKESVRRALSAGRSRVMDHDLARAAMDDCLVAVRAADDLAQPVANADRIAPEAAYQLGKRLLTLGEDARLEHLQPLVSALERSPRRALLFAEVLEWGWPYFRPTRRDKVRDILRRAAAKKFPDALPADDVAAIGRVYALAQEAGRAVPTNVLEALEVHHDQATAMATIALYQAAGDATSVRRLRDYVGHRDPEIAQAARDALSALNG